MKNKLTYDIIERWGEELQIEMITESSHKLGLALQKYKLKKDESELDLIDTYNEVCERIAHMKIMMDSAEFLFNKNEIDKHQEILFQHLKTKIDEY